MSGLNRMYGNNVVSPNPKVKSPKHYDKYTYAVKRRSEKDTQSPTGSPVNARQNQLPGFSDEMQPLMLNRDGFAVAEDGSLMSRVVSPPRYLFGFSMNHNQVSTSALGQSGSLPPPPPEQAPMSADPWQTFVRSAAGQLTEEELSLLQWDTVSELLKYYNITTAVDVAKVELVWKKKQQLLLAGETIEDAPPSMDASAVSYPEHNMLPHKSIGGLSASPIQQIAYGRPSSPRGGKRYLPEYRKPLNWKAESKVDCGKTVLAQQRYQQQ